eukprot:TRINITY_DN3076_c0_g2_i1.p1 TRINITY_DN3076_c0_g2~~TRINITY_DN3076_c0_g2_i1.p1  ORF type:complete len:513 (+),score=83.66 TRINITY_DN3076_c0_g2_i1:2-1540(+)
MCIRDRCLDWERVIVKGDVVQPREAHCSAVIGKMLYVFGGGCDEAQLNDLYAFDTETFIWKKMPTLGEESTVPEQTEEDASSREDKIRAMSIKEMKTILISNKIDTSSCVEKRDLQNLLILSSFTLSAPAAPSIPLPLPRSGGTLAAIGAKLYLFGGVNSTKGWLNDVAIYDTITNRWTTSENLKHQGTPPSPRDKASWVVIGDNLYLFGGFGPLNEQTDHFSPYASFTWFADTFKFDPESMTWTTLAPQAQGRAAHAIAVTNSADPESAKVYLFGGRDKDSRKGDMKQFDLAKNTWKVFDNESEIFGALPEARSFHTLSNVDDNHLLLFGGMSKDNRYLDDTHVFDSSVSAWMQQCTAQEAEVQETKAEEEEQEKQEVVHAEDASGRKAKCTIEDAVSAEITTKTTERAVIPRRAFHTTCVVGKYAYVFGGCFSVGEVQRMSFGDVWRLDLASIIAEPAPTRPPEPAEESTAAVESTTTFAPSPIETPAPNSEVPALGQETFSAIPPSIFD